MSVAVSLAGQYRRFVAGRVLVLVGLALALVAALLVDIASGPSGLGLGRLLAGDPLSRGEQVIFWTLRVPQAVMAVLVGAVLGLAGAELQTVLNNPLASPFTLGVSNAATLGAALAIVFDLALPGLGGVGAIPLLAFAFALGAMVLVQLLARLQGGGTDRVVLFGIAMVFVMNALLWLVQYVASAEAVQQIVFWTMGSLGRASWPKITVIGLVLALCLPWSLAQVWSLTALRGGEDQARAFGIAVDRLRWQVLLRVSLLAAAGVAFVGTIGFIGLVGPHIARLAVGEDHRFYLPASVLAGALVLSLAATAAKSLVPGLVLPVGIVTALVGVPLFMGLLFWQRGGRGA